MGLELLLVKLEPVPLLEPGVPVGSVLACLLDQVPQGRPHVNVVEAGGADVQPLQAVVVHRTSDQHGAQQLLSDGWPAEVVRIQERLSDVAVLAGFQVGVGRLHRLGEGVAACLVVQDAPRYAGQRHRHTVLAGDLGQGTQKN